MKQVDNIYQYSLNPINGKKHILPQSDTDQEVIDGFLKKHEGKPVIVVQGLGFVGAVMSLVCANAISEEYAVIGIDLPNTSNFWKIDSINNGQFPIIADDDQIPMLYNRSMEKGNLLATYDPYVYSKADVIIVDINLDVDKRSNKEGELIEFDVDLSHFKKAMQTIGQHCSEEVLVLVETTIPPGTCEQIIAPIINEELANRNLDCERWSLGHSYERVMPGPDYIDSIRNFYRVYAGIDERSADRTEEFLKTIIRTDEYPLTRLKSTNASEMAKVLENSYRAMNISFMIEWSRFAEEAGVDLYELVDAIRMRPTHKNIMKPGIGVGGYCLTKDPLLASWSRQHLFGSSALKDSESSVYKNDLMPLKAFEYLKKFEPELKNKKVLLLGVSYRQDVADTRYSPVQPFYNSLLNEGADILLHDPHVKYWEELSMEIESDADQLLARRPDIIIISTGHKMYSSTEFIGQLQTAQPAFIYDTIGVLNNIDINRLRKRHKLKILGRGDI